MRAVIPSVNYADVLAVTLPAWRKVLPSGALTVATSIADRETQAVARECGIDVFVTDAWTRVDRSCHWLNGTVAKFNKALALDEAFGFVATRRDPPAVGEVCVSIDVDGYPFGRFPEEAAIPSNTVVGCWRHHCATHRELMAHVSGHTSLRHFQRMKNSGGGPVGYLQAFRYEPGMRFGSYPNAGKYDVHFMQKHTSQRAMLEDLYILHLGPQGDGPNWSGRTVPKWVTA